MSLKLHTLIRHVGCAACTVVEENYLDLGSSAALMYTVGVVVQRHAEKVHGPVRIYNFSLAGKKGRGDPDALPASPSTISPTSSFGTVHSREDEEPQPADEPASEVHGGPVEPASSEDNDTATSDEDDDDDGGGGGGGGGDDQGEATNRGGRRQPRRLCNITAIVDWTTPPEARDALADMDLLRLFDEECREIHDYLRSRGLRDLIVLEYS